MPVVQEDEVSRVKREMVVTRVRIAATIDAIHRRLPVPSRRERGPGVASRLWRRTDPRTMVAAASATIAVVRAVRVARPRGVAAWIGATTGVLVGLVGSLMRRMV